ncbi:hypothetical protein [Flavivirga spongiicola]|uniref:Uncharacterized protein n=1 Tax=Flavivirga spongiicola TaxID=421621 RepID=A0ABU7XRW8_9FLAO|nr:hypothetical protein [Flavivirga sp. MEBiC05379]MDO5978168.1 hypothetical protein [Flavivirga sp. MEBiC05379]
MNVTSSKDVLNSPPGNLIKINSASLSGEISFSHKSSKTPLPPLVESFIIKNNQIQIDVIVFIDSSFPTPNFNVYQLYCINNSGDPKLQFFVDYDLKETYANNFNAYQVTFEATNKGIPAGIKLTDIKTIEACSWNVDPVTSRGTETIVQSN